MTTSTIEEITAITEPPVFDVPLSAPLAEAPTAIADTIRIDAFPQEEPSMRFMPASWKMPQNLPQTGEVGPLLPEEITRDLQPDSEIYHQAVGVYRARLALASVALLGLLAGVGAALVAVM